MSVEFIQIDWVTCQADGVGGSPWECGCGYVGPVDCVPIECTFHVELGAGLWDEAAVRERWVPYDPREGEG